MKRFLALIFAAVMLLSGCGKNNYGDDDADEKSDSASVSEDGDDNERPDKDVDDESSDNDGESKSRDFDEVRMRRCRYTIEAAEKPEVIAVELSGSCTGSEIHETNFKNLYGVNVLHSGVVGLVGAPVETDFSPEIEDARLTFYYVPEELRGIPETNLIGLHYNDEQSCYDEIMNVVLDTENCTVSMNIEENGVYMLADAFQWLGCWGFDVSEYAYDANPANYTSDWERECDTGSIMALADKEWAAENGPYFAVSTPAELAGAVYYVNALANGSEYVKIKLLNDIDLSGYDWKPMGWYNGSSHAFNGEIDGGGHTISNMTIDCAGESDIGFIGYGTGVSVRNLNMVNADVSGQIRVGILGGELYMNEVWENITVSGRITAGSTIDCGAIVGRESGINFKNSSFDVTVNGEPFEYFSYRQKKIAETEVVEAFTLTQNEDGSITRDDVEGYWNIGWYILRDGDLILHRSADDELTLPAEYCGRGDTIYLTAYIDGEYIRVSNIITR